MRLLLVFLFTIPLYLFSQKKLRDSIVVKTEIFTVIYSERLQQPLSVSYIVKCPNGSASRKGLDFYTCDSIITSDDKDYIKNVYDKGHMAPAADFNCSREMLTKTFTYLNCCLQHQDLNRTTWKLLEEWERTLSLSYKIVQVEVKCKFSKSSKKLDTGATVPNGFYKIIKYGNVIETYYFKNEKPSTTDFNKFKL